MDWKKTVTSFSEQIFPGISNNESSNDNCKIEIQASLPLQMSLYFNVIFFPFWILVSLAALPNHFGTLSGLQQFILGLALVCVCTIEVARLYLGYLGNLKEEMPHLAAFWLASLLFQTPLQLFFLLAPSLRPSSLECLTSVVALCFLATQLLPAYSVLQGTGLPRRSLPPLPPASL